MSTNIIKFRLTFPILVLINCCFIAENELHNNGTTNPTNNYTFDESQKGKQQKMFEKVQPSQTKQTNFHKLGTVFNRNVRKISVIDKNRRNTQFGNGDTQAIVDNLAPYMVSNVYRANQRNDTYSPQPQMHSTLRAFSPLNVSELDEAYSEEEYDKEYENTNDYLRGQFHDSRKAVSPLLSPSSKPINTMSGFKGRFGGGFKSPVPAKKPLPLINYDGTRNTPMLGTKPTRTDKKQLKQVPMGSFNNGRAGSRNSNKNYSTIDQPNDRVLRAISPTKFKLQVQHQLENQTMDCLAPGIKNPYVNNLKANQNIPQKNMSKKVKLQPLKNHSAIIDPQQNRKLVGKNSHKGVTQQNPSVS